MVNEAFPDALPCKYRLHWYVLESVLGQGGFGITYLARDTNLDRAVAIKEYLPVEVSQRSADATVRPRSNVHIERFRWGLERFIREAQTLAHFDHSNIVRVLAVFEANDTAYMIMRFEEGDNLASLLERRGALPENELLQILLPILDGLQRVHDARFIHRDIKPENIHIRRDGSPVLLDFGSARQSLNRTHTMTVLVARGYAPLEQYYGDPDSQGPWTDIYSLAATCYRVIAGKAPADALERVKGVLGSTREVLTPAVEIGHGRYSERLLRAIDHALELSEKDRPQTIAEWRQELVAGMPPPVRRNTRADIEKTTATIGSPAIPERSTAKLPPAPPSRSPATTWTAGLVSVVLIAIAVFAGMQYQSNMDTRRQIEEQRKTELAHQKADEERKRENDKLRQDEEERRRLIAQEATTHKTEPPALSRGPRLNPVAPAPAIPATRTTPPVIAEKPRLEVVPPRQTSPTEPESAPKQSAADTAPKAAAPDPMPKTADLSEKAEVALRRGDYTSALPIIQRLAAAGDPRSQAQLGNCYENGLGLPRNTLAAYMWYSLAVVAGHRAAVSSKERVAVKLQPAEIRQADYAVVNWKPRSEESGRMPP